MKEVGCSEISNKRKDKTAAKAKGDGGMNGLSH